MRAYKLSATRDRTAHTHLVESNTMSELLTREQLYELVWTEPMVAVAKRFGLSDVGIKKICAKSEIPVPPRGHWAKIEAGKRTFQPELPPRPPAMPQEIEIGKDRQFYWRGWTDEDLLAPLPPPPFFDEPIEQVRNRVREWIGRVRIPRDLSDQHSAVARLLREDKERAEKALTSSLVLSWAKPLLDSPESRRRLRIINSLFLAVARTGGKGYFSDKTADGIGVAVYDQHVRLKLVAAPESRRKHERNAAPARKRKALRLSIARGSSEEERVSWQDGEVMLEARIAEIAVEIVVTAEELYREQCQRMFDWRVERKKELEEDLRRRQMEEERKERERQTRLAKERIDRLLSRASAFTGANAIRAYVAMVCSRAADARIDEAVVEPWRSWALEQADHLDPVASGQCWTDLRDL